MAINCVLTNQLITGGLTKEEADELYMPFEDPGFVGMLWSQGENGDTIETMAEYDSGDGNRTSYLSIHREGASVDFGISQKDELPYSYTTLYSKENGGAVEMLASENAGEITLRGKSNIDGKVKTLTLSMAETPTGAFTRLSFNPIEGNDNNHAEAFLDFIKIPETSFDPEVYGDYSSENNLIRVKGLASPLEEYDAANKKYVDSLWQDPGFSGMLWTQDEDGNDTIEVMAGYKNGSYPISYMSIHNQATSVSMGVSEGRIIYGDGTATSKYSYLALESAYSNLQSESSSSGKIEVQASLYGAEVSLQVGSKKYVTFGTYHANSENAYDAMLLFDETPINPIYSKHRLLFLANGTENVEIRGIATPTEDTSAVNKKYIDNKIQYGTSAPSSLTTGTIYLVYE